MSAWPPVISQIGYPGAGDIDDCWCVATIWAALASDPGARKPTVPQFRKAAGNPDTRGKADGGSNTDCMQGAQGIWHDHPDATRWEGSWAGFAALVRSGRPASLAVRSSLMPSKYRFGFGGAHRVGLAYDGRFLLMNPLARTGAPLQPIGEPDIRRAAMGVVPSRRTLAVLFPTRAARGRVRAVAGTYTTYRVTGGQAHITGTLTTGGFSAGANPLTAVQVDGSGTTSLLKVVDGAHAGAILWRLAPGLSYTET